jgi:hypothetical protein
VEGGPEGTVRESTAALGDTAGAAMGGIVNHPHTVERHTVTWVPEKIVYDWGAWIYGPYEFYRNLIVPGTGDVEYDAKCFREGKPAEKDAEHPKTVPSWTSPRSPPRLRGP